MEKIKISKIKSFNKYEQKFSEKYAKATLHSPLRLLSVAQGRVGQHSISDSFLPSLIHILPKSDKINKVSARHQIYRNVRQNSLRSCLPNGRNISCLCSLCEHRL